MPQKIIREIIFAALALGTLLVGSVALAQTNTGSTTPPLFKPLPVTFPIVELGGCASKDECKAYCDIAANRDACFVYAQSHGLMRMDEIAKARQFIKEHASTTAKIIPGLPLRGNASSSIDAILAAGGGPGGCTARDACKTYCDDPANADECLQFAKDHNLMTGPEIELAKKLNAQVGPGGCQGEECKTYCRDVSHQQVCIEFARQNGFISSGDAQKRLEAMRLSSTTKPLPPIDDSGGRIASTTPKPRPNAINHEGSSTEAFNERRPPPPPPPPTASSSSEQGGSVFFAILHLLGL